MSSRFAEVRANALMGFSIAGGILTVMADFVLGPIAGSIAGEFGGAVWPSVVVLFAFGVAGTVGLIVRGTGRPAIGFALITLSIAPVFFFALASRFAFMVAMIVLATHIAVLLDSLPGVRSVPWRLVVGAVFIWGLAWLLLPAIESVRAGEDTFRLWTHFVVFAVIVAIPPGREHAEGRAA